MARSIASLLLFTLTACLHSSPDAAVVLAPLANQITPESADQGNGPENLVFADSLTANVFRSLRRDARYRIIPSGTRLFCPSKAAEGPQGYLLRARVNQMMGDSAIATVERMCGAPEGGMMGAMISTGVNYLLVRRSGKWKMEKPINGFSTIAM
jgi:hypothetical protein